MVPYPNMTFPIDWVAYDVRNSAVVFQVQNACALLSFARTLLTSQRSSRAAVPRGRADAVPVSQLDAPRVERKPGALDERRNRVQSRARCAALHFVVRPSDSPRADAQRTVKQWRKAGGKFQAPEALKYVYAKYPDKKSQL